jgi:aminoglycoside phosphotransferase (APT) family kinase protein
MRRAVLPGCSTLPAEALAAYLAGKWSEPVAIAGLKRFHGGASRQTFRFDATGARSGRREALVLRRDPVSSLIETDRAAEFAALRAFADSAVPVPEPLWLETVADGFGAPGFLMREIAGGAAAGLLTPEPYGDHAPALGEALFTALGQIHRTPPAAAGLEPVSADTAAAQRLAHWRTAFEADRLRPEPVIEAGFRWLERHPPPPAQRVSIVHGDFRSGNFLFADDRLLAILDWEMVHAGDPLEDLAWVMDPLWSHFSGRPAALLDHDAAIAVWEATSGLVADPRALRWWQVFAQVMGATIWVSSAREIADGRSHDPVLGFAATLPYRFHVMTLAQTLAGLEP